MRRKWKVQGGSNMTGTVYTVVYTQIIPVIFEPPCNLESISAAQDKTFQHMTPPKSRPFLK